MFGENVVTGYVGGRRFTALLRGNARERVGVSRGQLGTDEVLKIGSERTAFSSVW